MKIAISGASGFVGSHLREVFTYKGHEISPLGRELFQDGAENRLCDAVQGCEVVINLAGAPINHRWSRAYKQQMYESRVGVTRKLVEAINSLEVRPKLLISTSAVGYYPSTGCYDEYNSMPGDGFLSKLCVEWEKESQKVNPDVRVINTRFAVILSPNGGAFPKMIKPARFGLATIIGSGKQPFPWISLEDHGRAIEYIIDHPEISGVVNLIAPEQINNREFTRAVAKHFKTFVTIKIPSFVFKMFMGESSQFVIQGQCVKPAKLIHNGFVFKSATIQKFLDDINKAF